MLAVVTLSFDPTIHLGPLVVRWETVALGAAFFVALLVAAEFALEGTAHGRLGRLRLDDLLYLVMAAAPGAVVGGRVAYALDYLDYYRAQPGALIDPTRGSLSLLGAVVGGTLTAAYMARLLEVPTRRWLDALAIPLLTAIGLGKIAQLFGGGGQGTPFGGEWAVAFAGPGPWMSALPATPAHPSQLYEAAWALAGIVVVLVAGAGWTARRLPGFMRQHGRWLERRRARGGESVEGGLRFGYLYLLALQWWLVGRVVVGLTWRDPHVLGPLGAEQVLAIAVLVASAALGVAWSLPGRGRAASRALPDDAPAPSAAPPAAPRGPRLDRADPD